MITFASKIVKFLTKQFNQISNFEIWVYKIEYQKSLPVVLNRHPYWNLSFLLFWLQSLLKTGLVCEMTISQTGFSYEEEYLKKYFDENGPELETIYYQN